MLELGSIVYLKNGSQKLMIISRNVLTKNSESKIVIYDYLACKYPNGFDEKNSFYFNQENIDKVLFQGYSDEDEIRINELFNKWLKDNSDKFRKGKIIRE